MNENFDAAQKKEERKREIKQLDVEIGRVIQRNEKNKILKTENDYKIKVPDIEGRMGYPRLDHLTSSQEL